ncbi:MAG: ATP-dependent helicase HrpB [Caulobacteraceae bacterium]
MLPIHAVLPALRAALNEGDRAVLVAPPGAGKTTVVPLALLDEPWRNGGKLIVVEPRRLATRAAATRMAATLGERVGNRVGYRVRLDARVSAATRIEVVTDGLFTRLILDDPALEGVAAVLFDEFHERGVDSDLGLAFARDTQIVLRPDLRLLVMSATLDAAAVSRLLGDAPVVESLGRGHPVETVYLGRGRDSEDHTFRAVRRALADQTGGVLVFLPGQREIRRLADRLARSGPGADVDVAPLYGALTGAEQDLAIAPSPAGRRKVVIATDIAQTSLTIEDVRVVIDAGLARVPRYETAASLTRLATIRVSRASADQRRGRAGRVAPGVCYRLWDEAETRGLAAFDRPEILETDLSRVALDVARWGARAGEGLAFLDPPPVAGMTEARGLLRRLGALDETGDMTDRGRAMSRLPLPPRLAHMILCAAGDGQAAEAALIAVLASERGLGGAAPDLAERLERFAADRGDRAREAARLARRWADLAGPQGPRRKVSRGVMLARAFPERIAQAREAPGVFQLVGGRGVFVDPASPLAREPWLAIAELAGGEARDRIVLAAPLTLAEVRAAFGDCLTRERRLEIGAEGAPRVREFVRLGELTLEDRLDPNPPQEMLAAALIDRFRAQGLASLPLSANARAFVSRAAFLRLEPVSESSLIAHAGDWLFPLVAGRRSLVSIAEGDLDRALRSRLSRDELRRLEAEAPAFWIAPTGSAVAIDYEADGGPRIDIRVQEIFGLKVHPAVGGRPLTVALLSPARRPIQLTRDVPAFWCGSWREVRKAMRGRYPKHRWPEDPAASPPTTRAGAKG